MNHKELITALASKMNAPKSFVADLLELTVSTCIDQLNNGKTIGFQGFGNFEVRKKVERISVHPVSQVRTLIPPKLIVNFKQSNLLKDKLKKSIQS